MSSDSKPELKTFIHLEHEPDQIWTHGDLPDKIGLRFDCGDAGVIFLTREQTQELIDVLRLAQRKMGWTGPEKIQ